ncbi:MAG: nucleoside deaminase [Bacteroidales bacterium]|mgnify:CR=1 FL=1|nr:nucleoside deaminase [Bacteroidales bacterium]MDD4671208.1 nucleoside deaminase [Bacteroidales bacterium]
MYDKRFMNKAIELAIDNVKNGTGGPFGAVVVKDGEIISACGNTVTTSNDATAHAEINAIREACRKLSAYQLNGCEIYASCEPCPMCLGAIYWARPDKLYYASNQDDAAEVGFDDSFIYHEITLPHQQRSIPFIRHSEPLSGKEFKLWKESSTKKPY